MKSAVSEVLHPAVVKSVFKGTIALSVFSLFLQINSQTLIDYFGFVLLFYVFLGGYVFWKRSNAYVLGKECIEIKPAFRAPREINYSYIDSLSISQGLLAKRFNCGTVYLNLAHKGGKLKVLGGGSAEALRDVTAPKKLLEEIENMIGPSQDTNLQ